MTHRWTSSWMMVVLMGLASALVGCNEDRAVIEAAAWSDDDSQQAFVFNEYEYGKQDTYDPYHPFGHELQAFAQEADGSGRVPVGPVFEDVVVPDGHGIFFMKEAGYLLVPLQSVVGINTYGDTAHTLISLDTGATSIVHTTTADEPPDKVVPSPDGLTIAVVRQRVLEKVADEDRRPVVIEVYFIQGDFTDPESDRIVAHEALLASDRRLDLRWVDDGRLHFFDSHEVRYEVALGQPPVEVSGLPAPGCKDAPETSSSTYDAQGQRLSVGKSLEAPVVMRELVEGCGWE